MKSSNNTNLAITIAAIFIIIGGIMYAQSIVSPLLMAVFISIICTQPILWLLKKKVPMGLAVAMVFLGILAVFFGFAELIGNSLSSFSEEAPLYEDNLKKIGASILQFFDNKGIHISTDKMTNLFDPSKIMGVTAKLLSQLGGFMGNAFTIFFLVLFILLELESFNIKMKANFLNQNISSSFINVIGKNIRHYLSIKTLTSLLTGIFVWLSLLIIGVNYAVLWGLIAFLLNYIPNIGSILAAVPAILFASIQLGMGGAFWTLIVFVVVNVGVGSVIEPKIMGKGLGLSTFIVFFALIFWGFIMGAVGMFLSVPLTMAIKIMLEQNEKTKPIAIFLGTQEEAQGILDEKKEISA